MNLLLLFLCTSYSLTHTHTHTHTQGLTYLQISSQPSVDSQPLKYVTELTHQFSAPDVTNDDIFDWIEVGGASVVVISVCIEMMLSCVSPTG